MKSFWWALAAVAVVVAGTITGLLVLTGTAGGQAGPLVPEPPPWGGVIYGLTNNLPAPRSGPDPSDMQIIGATDSPLGACTNFVPTTIGNQPSVDGYMSVWLDNHPSHDVSFFGSRSPSIDGIPKIDRWVGVPGQQAFTLVTTWNTASGLSAQSITVLPAGPPASLYVVSAEGSSIYTYDALSATPGTPVMPPFNCAPSVNHWNQVAVGAAGDAWALGTQGGGPGVAAPNYITCVPQPGNPTGCDSSCGGLVPVPTSPAGFDRVNEDLSWSAGGVWVVVQSDPATPRWDGALHAYDPFVGAWIASRYDMGGRRLFPARWANCHDGVYVFREKSPGAGPVTPDPRADLYLVDRFLTVLARFTYPASHPGDALGPVNMDLAGDVWVSLDPLDTPWTEVLYDKFSALLAAAPCGITPPLDPVRLQRRYRSPFARGPGSWYYRSFMESGPCDRGAPTRARGALASPVPPRAGGR